jgi:hypothetical protein
MQTGLVLCKGYTGRYCWREGYVYKMEFWEESEAGKKERKGKKGEKAKAKRAENGMKRYIYQSIHLCTLVFYDGR